MQLYAVQVSKKATILFYNVYGYTGAAKDKKAANRTNDILEAIFEDQEQQPKGPAFIVGDLNGDQDTFPALSDKLQEGWLNVGAQESRWGKQANDYTCRAPNATNPTIRDYIVSNREANELIVNYKVDHEAEPLHSILRMTIRTRGTTKETRVPKACRPG